ncbi:MAG: hypothetical protein KF862_12745 [Chitinophagaceae bacterium]|nr:hypothetical protein [Chitinophagaceae bacterium]
MLERFPCDRQMDMTDCGPACLKMIAKYYGNITACSICGINVVLQGRVFHF